MTTKQSSGSNKSIWLIGAIVSIIAIAAIVAVASSSGEDAVTAGVEEFHDVQVVGDALPELNEGGTDPAIGMTAPVITGQGFIGDTVTTDRSAKTLIVFLAHWCPHCQREVPLLVKWRADGLLPDDLDVIAITTSTDPASPNFPPSEWLAREDWPVMWPVMTDSGEKTAANAFGVSGFPFFTLIDENGKVVGRASGEIELEALTALLNKSLNI